MNDWFLRRKVILIEPKNFRWEDVPYSRRKLKIHLNPNLYRVGFPFYAIYLISVSCLDNLRLKGTNQQGRIWNWKLQGLTFRGLCVDPQAKHHLIWRTSIVEKQKHPLKKTQHHPLARYYQQLFEFTSEQQLSSLYSCIKVVIFQPR